MVGRPQKRTRETRDKILVAARDLFDAQGYEETSVDAVAERAGVAKATVFAHFNDKANLLIAVRIGSLDALAEAMRAQIDRGPTDDPAAFLAGLLHPWLALYRADPEFARLYLVQSTLKDAPWTRQFLDVCYRLEEAVVEAASLLQASGRLAAGAEPVLLAQGVLAFFYHMIVGFSIGAIPQAEEQAALFDRLVSRWVSTALPPPGA
ncbi:TetR/AcrR family transcriptional regulator [Stappia sp. TSB10GB4]|uniref:TetR/AcrR family transcriptional regulator n=1 Tax=Stappia sp. TSB10GB4 TaxID=2003584 RepID=UPI001644E719|nr:TetR/AcrR family transcriptional regulator [Stappia sp. TSB10GB4]